MKNTSRRRGAGETDSAPEPRVRLDKWLWAARFFKTRALAQQAIEGGKVHCSGERVKPARGIRTGERLEVRLGPYTRTVVVSALSERRGPAREAALLYEETPESIAARELLAEQRRLQGAVTPSPAHRPNKKERRRIIRFTRKG